MQLHKFTTGLRSEYIQSIYVYEHRIKVEVNAERQHPLRQIQWPF